MNNTFIKDSDKDKEKLKGISMSDGTAVYKEEKISLIDELVNDEKDLEDMRKAEERIIPKKDKRVIRLLAFLNVAVFAFLGFFILTHGGNDAYSSIKGKSDFDPKTGYYDPSSVFANELSPDLTVVEFAPKVTDKFKPLLSKNEDTVGWVSIDGTIIDYVVVQSEDNVYYERKNFDKDYSIKGIIFMDYRDNIAAKREEFSKNTILYGHHVPSDGTMFTSIEKYRDIEYYKKHPTITYNTIYGDYTWKIIGAFLNYPNEPGTGEEMFYYWYTDFTDDNTIGYANEVASRSYFVNPSVDVRSTDKFLTLSTCSYLVTPSENVKGRFVVVARLVRQGEDRDVDIDKAYENEDQRMPGLWYSSRGLKDPYKNAPVWAAY